MGRAARLYRLQQLDMEEERARGRLSEIAASLGESPALRQARKAAQDAADRAQQWAIRQRDLELEVQGIKNEIAASERRLYGGSIRNPKELGDLQAKVASLKRFLERREEDLLEAMIVREEAEAAQGQAQARLEDVEATWASDQAALRAEKEQLEARLAKVAQDREALLPSIPPEDMEAYRVLRRTKGGLAVSVMRAGACAACGMEV
ncbi:MAG TPA: hypothetical protein EYH30_06655, partial [Anaerolineales bacterium]|nr:hypothetical protein [Anaerolineales bacterium]